MSGHEFQSYFPESGGVDYADTSTNIDDTTMSELRELAGRYPQARSALLWLRHGWHVALAYVVGFSILFVTLGWHPDAVHKTTPNPRVESLAPQGTAAAQ